MFKVVRTLLLGGLLGKVLGVLRELIFAWLFGTGAVASAYRLAQSAFLIPLHGFVSEAINGGFTPQYAKHRNVDPARSAALFSGLYTVMLLVSAAVAIALFVWAEQWVSLLAPGFDRERSQVATAMLQLLSLALPAYVVSGLFASVDLAIGRGSLSAARASLQSLGLILGTLAAHWLGMPTLIAAGFVIAYVAFAVIGGRVVRQEGLSLRLVSLMSPEIRSALMSLFRVIRVLIWIPVAFQFNAVVERRVASLISSDAMAAIDYSRFVTETLVILVAMPVGLAGLSTMASMSASDFRRAKLKAFRALLYVGLPLSALLSVNAQTVVSLVFERGAFGASSAAVTAQILSGMAVGIWGQLIGYAGAKFLSARGRNSGALVASLVGVACSVATLLLAQPYFGVAVLGVAAAVHGIVFGGFVLWRLEVVAELGAELSSLACLALVYVAVSWLSPWPWGGSLWLTVLFSSVFWCAAMFGLPWHRRPLIRAYRMARTGR